MDEPPQSATIVDIRNVSRGRQRLVVLNDGREFLFSDEAVERARVAAGQVADSAVLAELEAQEQRVAAHESALRLLSSRPRSEREMRTRLAMRGIDPDAVDGEIERLVRAGLLDDEKFALSWVEDRKRTAPRGRRMLRYELLGRGIEPESVDLATEDVDDRETALELARNKSRTASLNSYEDFLGKVGAFLRRRGFDYSVAAEATRIAWAEANEARGVQDAGT
ncbi:hypothetical protein AYO38_10940 [bacterium SCGC AG-212-C10]|nr:hypothetical protein AYO38_10940 [bacterium SCGC AG-212-C10]